MPRHSLPSYRLHLHQGRCGCQRHCSPPMSSCCWPWHLANSNCSQVEKIKRPNISSAGTSEDWAYFLSRIWAMREVSFPRSDSRCRWYVRDLSSSTPRYVGILARTGFFRQVLCWVYNLPPCCSDGRQPTPFLTKWTSATKSGGMLLVSLGLG